MDALLAFGAALVALRLSAELVRRYRRTRAPELLAWAAALAAYAAAAGALAWGAAAGWSEAAFRVYYLGGALLTAPLLGAGSLLLVGPALGRCRSRSSTAGIAVGVALAVPLEAELAGTDVPGRPGRPRAVAGARARDRGELARDARGRRRRLLDHPPAAARQRAHPRRSRRRRRRERARRPRRRRPRADPRCSRRCFSMRGSSRLRRRGLSAQGRRPCSRRARRSRIHTARNTLVTATTTSDSTIAPRRPRARLALREQPQPSDRVQHHQREHRVLGA